MEPPGAGVWATQGRYKIPIAVALKVDIRVPVGGTVLETAEFAAKCEQAGFDGVGIIDHQHTGRDVFLAMALAADRTRRVTLYPAVTNPVTRHPMVLASIAQSLEEIAPHRVILCIGAGFMSTRHINRGSASVKEMRETVDQARRLLDGENVYPGITEGRLVRTSDPSTPVYVCATGPRMIELAGEIADGAMLMVGLDPGMVADAMDHLGRGAERAGRTVGDIPITLVCGGILAQDRETALELARPICWGQMHHPVNGPRLERAGLEWPAGLSGPDDIPTDVLSRVCDATGLFGDHNTWAKGVNAAGGLPGVRRLFIQPNLTYEFPERVLANYRDRIRPLLS